MERFVRGDIVVLLFPFSDLSSSRKRPAVVVANLTGDDLILAQITTAYARSDEYAVPLDIKDFQTGKLSVPSLVRPNKLFTADISIISSKIGALKKRQNQRNSKYPTEHLQKIIINEELARKQFEEWSDNLR